MSKNIEDIRKEINEIDKKILHLVGDRAKKASKIGELKSNSSDFVYKPDREKYILENLKNEDVIISKNSIQSIFTEIISACRGIERNLTISFLGPEASYTHDAAIKQFGSSVNYKSLSSIESIFYDVEQGVSDYGVVPVENSTGGTVNYTLDKFMESDLKIVAESELKIKHCLMSKETQIENIKKIYSHPQSFYQCRNWIFTNMRDKALYEVNSNSLAAKMATEEENCAAIASEIAAKKYNLNIVHKGINDNGNNTTRFLVIGRNLSNSSGNDKTSIVFSPQERVGVLYEALGHFLNNNVNLTMIESRPNKKEPWRYVFFVDMEGHLESNNINLALDEIKKISKEFKILGSYPKNIVE